MPTDSADLKVLEELNRGYVRSAQDADVRWYDDNLAADFMSGNPDGTLADKSGFLARIGRGANGARYAAEEVQIRILGDVALIHAGFRAQRTDGSVQLGRYTDIWQRRSGRWLCVAAQFGLQPAQQAKS
jgi:ketosteroid isomerase-like protein